MQALSLLEIKLAKMEQLTFEQEKLLQDRETLIKGLRSEIEILRDQNQAALNEVDRRGQRLREMRRGYEGSTSWRVTRPLRWLSQRLRGKDAPEVGRDATVDEAPLALHAASREGASALAAPSEPAQATDTEASARLAVADRHDYAEWIRRFDTHSAEERARFEEVALSLPDPALVTLLSVFSAPIPSGVVLAGMQAVRDCLIAQYHTKWEWLIVCEPDAQEKLVGWASSEKRIRVISTSACKTSAWEALNAGLQHANGEWLAWIDDRVQLRAHALVAALQQLKLHPSARMLYADDDKMDGEGSRSDPAFRCEVNLDLLKASDYLGQFVLCSRQDLLEAQGWNSSLRAAHRHDLWLRLVEGWEDATKAIIHEPHILSHRRVRPGGSGPSGEALLSCWTGADDQTKEDPETVPSIVQAHLARQGLQGVALPHPDLVGACRVRFTLPQIPPRVGIVIPTRDNVGVLSVCLESLLQQSSYPDIRVVVVDNGSVKPETLAYLHDIDDPRVKVLKDGAPFNFSRLINHGAATVEGEVLCLLNNDMQITQSDWLEEMVGWALQERVAAVGARLWYADGSLQHGGIVLGIQGVAGHAHKYLAKGAPGYQNRALLHQTMSAVTGACMVVRRQVFEQVGGFDEALGVAYNDVDFCLRARKAGYRNIWTPHAEMIHHESISRGFEDSPEKQARFQREAALMRERWADWLDNDPAYNPNLTLEFEDFGLAWPPRASVV